MCWWPAVAADKAFFLAGWFLLRSLNHWGLLRRRPRRRPAFYVWRRSEHWRVQDVGVLSQGRPSDRSWGVMSPTFRGKGGRGTKLSWKHKDNNRKYQHQCQSATNQTKELGWLSYLSNILSPHWPKSEGSKKIFVPPPTFKTVAPPMSSRRWYEKIADGVVPVIIIDANRYSTCWQHACQSTYGTWAAMVAFLNPPPAVCWCLGRCRA